MSIPADVVHEPRVRRVRLKPHSASRDIGITTSSYVSRLFRTTPFIPTMRLEDLPDDVLLAIARYLPNTGDLLHLSQSSKTLYEGIAPALYHTVILRNRSQCLATLPSLYRKPSVARHMQHLTLRPHGLPSHQEPSGFSLPHWLEQIKNADISVALMRICRLLKSLRTFVWDADDLPANDEMWFVLRSGCPNLRHIGVSIGAGVPYENSQLWAFKNLTSFALHLRPAFFFERVANAWPDEQPDLSDLFAMLDRCPELETLMITGDSTEPLAMQNLLSCQWPKLKTLVLGDILVQTPQPAQQQALLDTEEELPLTTKFLLAHPHLETLHLSSRSGIPLSHLTLPSAPLESASTPGKNLHTFSGTLAQLLSLPSPTYAQLTALHLREPILLRETAPLSICTALKHLPSIRKLSASFILHSSYDHGGILRAIVAGSPGLEELDFVCAAKPCYLLESVGRAVRELRALRVLALALVVVPGEDNPLDGAVRIARANLRLERFTVTRLARTVRLPLRMPLSEGGRDESGVACGRTSMEKFGFGAVGSTAYTLERDRWGIPKALNVREIVGTAGLRVCLPVRVPVLWGGEKRLPWMGLNMRVGSRRLYASAVHGHPVARMIMQRWRPADDSTDSEPDGFGRVLERGWASWECGTVVRKWTCDLRPAGHPERALKGWKDLVLRDESPAGEEARMMSFCVVLAVVVLWVGISRI